MTTIPNYFLYGESDPHIELEFVHCEPLYSRIAEENWEIKPHRHDLLFQLIYMENGELRTQLDTQNLALQSPVVVTIPPGYVHGFRYGPDVKGHILTISVVFLSTIVSLSEHNVVDDLLSEISLFPLTGDVNEVSKIEHTISHIVAELTTPRFGRVEIVASLIKVLFVLLRRLKTQSTVELSKTHQNFFLFKGLVEKNFRRQWTVRHYCEVIGLTEKQLNRLCNLIAQKSASALIQERLIIEAKRGLVYTVTPISSIAYGLGFSDPAYFSRFFTRHCGESPSHFRKKVRETVRLNQNSEPRT